MTCPEAIGSAVEACRAQLSLLVRSGSKAYGIDVEGSDDDKVRELSTVSDGEADLHLKAIRRLRGALNQASAESALAEEPRRAADLDAFLVRLRLKG